MFASIRERDRFRVIVAKRFHAWTIFGNTLQQCIAIARNSTNGCFEPWPRFMQHYLSVRGKSNVNGGKCFRCPDGLIEHWQVYLKRGPSRGRDRLSSSTRSHQHHPRQTWHLCRRPILCNSNNNNINSKRQALINSNNINNSKR